MGFLRVLLFLPNIIAVLVNTLGSSMENLSAPFWFDHLPSASTWAVLFICSCFFFLFFAIGNTVWCLCTGTLRSRWFPGWKMVAFAFAIGLFDALNGLFVIYMSSPKRVPVLFQSLIIGIIPPISYAMSFIPLPGWDRYFFHERRLTIVHWRPIMSFVCLLLMFGDLAWGKAVLPHETLHYDPAWTFFFCLMFVIGQVFGSLYNVLQKPWLRALQEIRHKDIFVHPPPRPSSAAVLCSNTNGHVNDEEEEAGLSSPLLGRSIPEATTADNIGDKLTLLHWQCLGQLVFVAALVWTDMIPNFGGSTPATFGTNIRNTLINSMGVPYGGATQKQAFSALGSYLVFSGGYAMAYVAAAFLNYYSPVFQAISASLTTVVVTIIVEALPKLFSDRPLPLWSAVHACIFCCASIVLWSMHEQHERQKSSCSNEATV